MRILCAIDAALFSAITVKGIWDHNGGALFGSILVLVLWAVIWPDLTEQPSRR